MSTFGSPWQFLLPEECAHASAACKNSWICVAEWTPIGHGHTHLQEHWDVDEEYSHDEEDVLDDLSSAELEALYQEALRTNPDQVEETFAELHERARKRERE